MNVLAYLIPISLTLGALGLFGFLWTLRSDQYDKKREVTFGNRAESKEEHSFWRQGISIFRFDFFSYLP